MAGEDGLLRDVLRDHRLAEPVGRDEHDVARTVEKGQAKRGLDLVAVDLLGPGSIEVDHRLESANSASSGSALEAPPCAVLLLGPGDVLEQLLWAKAPVCAATTIRAVRRPALS